MGRGKWRPGCAAVATQLGRRPTISGKPRYRPGSTAVSGLHESRNGPVTASMSCSRSTRSALTAKRTSTWNGSTDHCSHAQRQTSL